MRKLGFDLRQLEIFRAAVSAGTLTEAGRMLGLTQSAVSQVIASLEKEFEVSLIDRSIRPVQVTTAGRMLLERAEALLTEATELDINLRRMSRNATPTLRISMVASLTTVVGPQFVRELGHSFKRCSLFANLRGVSEQQFRSREIDILIGVDLLRETDVALTIPLLIEPFALLLPEAWDKPVASLADLQGLSFIRHTQRTSAGRQIEQAIRQRRLDFPREFESDTADTIATMVSAGLGWTITTPLIALQTRERLRGTRLVALPAMKLRRRVDLYARKSELGTIPQEVAQLLCKLLRTQALPLLRDMAPWMGDQFHLFEQEKG
ncbi:LysR family transcriptional regulator [Bosea sp. 2KB_26]|uniref:LysR family transcriptional regulator n=1 Tax=Bosea sp. 2KB_26 TaxID=3237475 RepID=UPI000DE23440